MKSNEIHLLKALNQFEHVYIESNTKNSEIASRILQSSFPKDKIQIIDDDFFKKGELSSKELNHSKKRLLLKEFKGSFFKRCPGAKPHLMCCNYYVLNLGQHCEMDCSYCYLQSFINFPAVVIYTNIEDAFEELKNIALDHKDDYVRVGTGEQTDSLSLDDISLYSARLLDFFKDYPSWNLEFKTKSDNIKNFENKEHKGNIIASWSINPEYIIKKEEHKTASLKNRLQSARKLKDKGFKISFHIDPVIYHSEWKKNYKLMAEEILSLFQPHEIYHISLGALRFPNSQKSIMRQRFGIESLVLQGEFFRSRDGKLRYDNDLRNEMFRYIIDAFKCSNPEWNIFLCMENPENWLNTIKKLPKSIPSLKKDFSKNLY